MKFLSCLLLVGCAVAAVTASSLRLNNADPNIVELAASVPDLSTLVTALKAANLTGALSGTGPFTVFAPTNEAFAALPKSTLDHLLDPANIKELQAVLEYHVIGGAAIKSSDLKTYQTAKSLQGDYLVIQDYFGHVIVDHAKVTSADNKASNGVVHIIDKVLIPYPSPTPSPATKKLREFKSVGAWEGGGNGATAVPSAKTLAEGAATTFETFSAALNACTLNSCDVYFNFHTKYSFSYNDGAYGLARAQLMKDDRCDDRHVKCFTLRGDEAATSENTNQVAGIPHQLPSKAGSGTAKLYWRYPFGETDFELSAELSVDSSIDGNTEIIGAHLHTGDSSANGPVNIVFCGSSPLPAPIVLNGECRVF